MTDQDIKQTMRAIAAVNKLPLSDERIDADLETYKSHLAALDRIAQVALPAEAEPLPIVALKRAQGK